MYVSNVGDSRAIIGSLNTEGRIVAKPMSSDHTPYRYTSKILSVGYSIPKI